MWKKPPSCFDRHNLFGAPSGQSWKVDFHLKRQTWSLPLISVEWWFEIGQGLCAWVDQRRKAGVLCEMYPWPSKLCGSLCTPRAWQKSSVGLVFVGNEEYTLFSVFETNEYNVTLVKSKVDIVGRNIMNEKVF